jgi:predicted metalloprotease with PDZ domain
VIDSARNVTAVLWDSPAFRSGLTTGSEVVAVNGVAFDADNLRAIVKATKPGSPAIELLIKQGDSYRTLPIPYESGLRYPRLQRIPKTRALLDDILAPRR